MRRLSLRHGIQCVEIRLLQDLLPHPAPQPIGGPLCARPPAQALYERVEIARSCKTGLKKIPSPLSILSRIVVECSRDLDQTLQEHFFRIESLEPDFLPMFMGVKEAP